jgi:hypothetical protein
MNPLEYLKTFGETLLPLAHCSKKIHIHLPGIEPGPLRMLGHGNLN